VFAVRTGLTQAGLRTDPDFEAAYLDSTVQLLPAEPAKVTSRKDGISDSHLAQEETRPDATNSAGTPNEYADPTYRISRLEAAQHAPISVKPDAPIAEAVTIMMSNDYSQLPVMTSERDVKGVISWASIGSRLALGLPTLLVREAMETHHEVSEDDSLLTAMQTIAQHEYVLVKGRDRRITGIITASDISRQFHQLAEPFLLLSQIENHIRRILLKHFSIEELKSSKLNTDSGREVKKVADLTIGEYVRVLADPRKWERLQLRVDRAAFIERLDRVRDIRNDVMHFDPDGITRDDLTVLREFSGFLSTLQKLGAT